MRKEKTRNKKLKATGWRKRKRGEVEKGEEDAGEGAKLVPGEENEEKSAVGERKASGKSKFLLGPKVGGFEG